MGTTTEGLTIDRVFSQEGENPLDSTEWVTRDASIKNPEGEIIFSQKDVEVPENWSPLATNIVASKYFYGDPKNLGKEMEDGGREFSVRQLIHRVTKTISDWGFQKGYFHTQEDAQVFYDELTWLCLHQHGSFNSPVWFNVGLNTCYGITDSGDRKVWGWSEEHQDIIDVDPYEYPQASACFIISVEDSIDDIWRLLGESARLFKYGSGVGSDWSTLRSTQEKLSGGGVPSGPVSFMRVQDSTGGTIKSGGKTRRAAIMQTLKVWHPDIETFITAKKEEEVKAWSLIEQGYDGSFNGPAYGSVAFQNVNQSVRVTDEFMQAVEGNTPYPLLEVVTKKPVRSVNARRLIDLVAEGTHLCGDPGLQYEDTIQFWHTCSNSAPINSSNPCSEYMFLDNSACNLASLNLCKFLSSNGTINTDRLRAATRVFITAMDILVDHAGYPSESIARNSHEFRPLGLGFANLGALLMSLGVPYDSDEGRSIAAGIMSIIHAEAYAQSAHIASNSTIGPFKGYKVNKEKMQVVIQQHYRAGLRALESEMPQELMDASKDALDSMRQTGLRYGFRNSQVTVLAPTDTIAFMMDCDTTGIEPDIALVKYKLLAGAGDGVLKIVNRSVHGALSKLGYPSEAIEEIINYIDKHDMIEGAPNLSPDHLSVFDCAFKPHNGHRSVSSMGHVKMMAACQPFISGAISKTVNVPEDVTIDEIREVYMEGWRLGLKALAVYRENSKRSQPLSTSRKEHSKAMSGDGLPDQADVSSLNPKVVYKAVRQRLPDDRVSLTHKFSIGGHEGYLHIGLYPDRKRPGEIFVRMSKEGSTLSGLMEAFAISISLALQYGVPLDDLIAKYRFMRFEPNGFTTNRDLPQVSSIIDYIFRYLDHTFNDPLKNGTWGHMVETDHGAKPQQFNHESYEQHPQNGSPQKTSSPAPALASVQSDSPICVVCGGITVRSGACYVCTQCGSSSGCG